MEYAKLFKLISVAVVSLYLPLSAFAGGCSAEAKKSTDGSYAGCVVTMGNREFTIAAAQSSEGGCSQVCSIMSEIGGATKSGKTARADSSI
jgi:hypothetical protein